MLTVPPQKSDPANPSITAQIDKTPSQSTKTTNAIVDIIGGRSSALSAAGASIPRVDSSESVTGRFSGLRTANQTTETTTLKPPAKPRAKAGGGFGALLKSKPKKLSTLEKSRMDWNSHVAEAGDEVKEELEANRRGGGYIEKVEFLGRVSDRLEETLDSAKGGKRKR